MFGLQGCQGGSYFSEKHHDGCEIQLLEGEDTHTRLLVQGTFET